MYDDQPHIELLLRTNLLYSINRLGTTTRITRRRKNIHEKCAPNFSCHLIIPFKYNSLITRLSWKIVVRIRAIIEISFSNAHRQQQNQIRIQKHKRQRTVFHTFSHRLPVHRFIAIEFISNTLSSCSAKITFGWRRPTTIKQNRRLSSIYVWNSNAKCYSSIPCERQKKRKKL